jgi:hypothetical protein
MDIRTHKMYIIDAPLVSHFRPGTCAEANCGPHLHGWRSGPFNPLHSEDAVRIAYIRQGSERRFTEESTPSGIVFTFEPGQRCFGSDRHRVPLEREPNYLVREGGGLITHGRADQWVDDFATHQQGIADARERG